MKMEEWKEYKVAEVIEDISMGPFGSNIKRDNYVDSGVPYLNGSNLSSYKLNENSFNYVTEEKANNLGRCVAKRGDIIVTHRGTIGQISYIPNDSIYERYLTGNSQFRLTVNRKIIRPDFFVYYFHTRMGQYKLLANASQVGVPALARPTSTFKEVLVPVPKMEVQNKIMGILLSLDDKIAVNRRICENLEAQAQALFKHWFIDFAPFKNGKFVESELGMIPEGWRVGMLRDICTYSNKKIAISQLTHTSYYSTENMLPNKAGAMEASSLPQVDMTTGCLPYDVLVSNIRPYFKKIIRVETTCGCSTDVLCFHPVDTKYMSYMYRVLYDDSFFAYVMAGSKGTKMPRGDKQQIMKYPIVIPTNSVLEEYSILVEPMFELISSSNKENLRLSTLRDTLLPKLMSGQIKVDEIEKRL